MWEREEFSLIGAKPVQGGRIRSKTKEAGWGQVCNFGIGVDKKDCWRVS
jgi:hypothetical protein